MTTISTLLGLVPPIPYAVKKLLASPNNAPDPALIYGVELEIEHINPNNGVVTAVRETTDNSLRNNGREYITSPMCFRELEYVLTNFFSRNKFTDNNYSERCSVHVHANCTDLTPEQLSTLLLIYQVYEQSLFNFVGGDRDKNIFCVPWSETTLTFGIVNRLMEQGVEALRRWQKYTALNLLPLFTQGSIEFRHMPGTHDVSKIMQWCSLIGCMFSYARKTPLEEVKTALVQLNTTSEYKPLTEAVFGNHAPILLDGEQAVLAIENGIVNMKYSLMKDDVVRPTAGVVGVDVPRAIAPGWARAQDVLRMTPEELDRYRNALLNTRERATRAVGVNTYNNPNIWLGTINNPAVVNPEGSF